MIATGSSVIIGGDDLVFYFPTDQVGDYVGQPRRFAEEIRPKIAA